MENNQFVTDLFFWITFGEIAALSCFVPANDALSYAHLFFAIKPDFHLINNKTT